MSILLSIAIALTTFCLAVAEDPVNVIDSHLATNRALHGKGNIYAPEIVRHGGEFMMYYGGQGDDGHDRIHLATSTDLKTWNHQGAVFAPIGVNHVNDPSVVIVNKKLLMYYTRANAGVTDCIGLATSIDGREWLDRGPLFLPRSEPAWDSLLVGRPSVIYEGGIFRLWYDGRKDLPTGAPDLKAPKSATSQRYVGYAHSTDGITWVRHRQYVLSHDSGAVHVSRHGELLVMLIESREGTKWASSNDGLAWEYRGVLIAKDQGTAPHGHVTPFLFKDRGEYLLYFGAAQSQRWDQNSIMSVKVPWLQTAIGGSSQNGR